MCRGRNCCIQYTGSKCKWCKRTCDCRNASRSQRCRWRYSTGYRNIEEDGDIAKIAEKKKKAFAGTELTGKKLGVIGLGAIGVLVANAATHLGMEVYGYDPYVSVDSAWRLSRSIHHANNSR